MLLSLKIVLEDLEAVDAEFFNSLQYILENDPADVGLTFVVGHPVLAWLLACML